MRTIPILLIAVLLLTSCRSEQLIRPGDTIDVAFEKAYALYEREEWRDAAQAFETVISIGRGTDFGQDAQFYLAESYFNNRQFLLASSEYERYVRLHPNSHRREAVDFKIGLCYYRLSPRYNLDQNYTRQAIQQFRLFNSRYPNSERVTESAEYINELRNKLAKKRYHDAAHYMRINQYNAAAEFYDLLIDEYPETKWAERALYKQVEAYIFWADNSIPVRQAERYQKAIDSYEKYLQLFPRGENRSAVEELYDRARESLYEITGNDLSASDVTSSRG